MLELTAQMILDTLLQYNVEVHLLAVFVLILDSLSTLDTDFSSVGIEQAYIYINDNDMDICEYL